MPVRIILICLLALYLAPEAAYAAGDVVREQRALFILEGFQQWVETKYQFSDHYSTTDNQSSASHLLQEDYNARLLLDVLSPHVLANSLSASFGLDQNRHTGSGKSSSTGGGLHYQYQYLGIGLDKSVTPFSVSSFQTSNTVNSPFSPSFTTSSSGNSVKVALHNQFLPSAVSFTRNTLENSGGGFDSSTTSNTFTYSASNRYRDLASTDMSLSMSNSGGSFSGGSLQDSRAYQVTLGNNLVWGESKKYSLTSTFQQQKTKTEDVPQSNLSFGEVLQVQLGKALGLEVRYGFANSSTIDFSGQDQTTSFSEGEVTLKHSLFDSVKTHLSAKASSNELLAGVETRYSGVVGINYSKKLPESSVLNLSLSGVHEVVDNRLGSSVLTVKNESHPGVHQGDVITLPLASGSLLRSVISVASSNPLFTYSELADYTIDFFLGQITIVRGGRIGTTDAGTDLLISYTLSLDAVLKYANDSLAMSGDLSLFGGKYSVGGSYSQQSQSVISGLAQNSLRDSSAKTVHFSGNVDTLNYRLSFSDHVTGVQDVRFLEGTGQYAREFRLSTLILYASERYTMFGATPELAAFTENAAEFSVGNVWNLSKLRLTTSANLLDTRSETRGTRDLFFFRASSRMAFNKLSISLDGQAGWNFFKGSYQRDDSIALDITRYF